MLRLCADNARPDCANADPSSFAKYSLGCGRPKGDLCLQFPSVAFNYNRTMSWLYMIVMLYTKSFTIFTVTCPHPLSTRSATDDLVIFWAGFGRSLRGLSGHRCQCSQQQMARVCSCFIWIHLDISKLETSSNHITIYLYIMYIYIYIFNIYIYIIYIYI